MIPIRLDEKKRGRYGESRRYEFGGLWFDSKGEARRWSELTILERLGHITGLERQVAFELAPSVRLGGRTKPALRYIADFVYWKEGVRVVEDFKGKVLTDVFRVKLHLMMAIHGIEVKIVT